MSKRIESKYANIIKVITIFLIYFIWPYLLTVIFNAINIEGNLALSIRLIFNFVLLGIIIYMFRTKLKLELAIFRENWKKNMISGFLILIISFILFNIANIIIYQIYPLFENENYTTLSKIFETTPILLFMSTIFFYPIVEELVFKSTFKDVIKNKWIFIIITGVLNVFFQIALSSYTDSLLFLYLMPNFILSMGFSYMYYKTNNVVTPIIYRMIYNLIPNLMAIFLLVI